MSMRSIRSHGLVAMALGVAVAAAGAVHADVIPLTSRIRDFTDAHPDFEIGPTMLDPGIIEPLLDADKKPVYAGQAGNPSTSGKENFDQWFRDTPNINLGGDLILDLDNTITPDARVYTFDNMEFFPIDDSLLGNQGRDHNYHFTVELHTQGIYRGGEILKFTSDDDLWVAINGHVIVDIGGVHRPIDRTVPMDIVAAELGLQIGDVFDYDLFYAERNTHQAALRFDVPLVPSPAAATLFSLALGFGCMRRRR